jgi:hypothetical protein
MLYPTGVAGQPAPAARSTRMDDANVTALAQRDHPPAHVSGPLARRPTLDPEPWTPARDPEPWTPPQLSAGFAVGWVLTVAVLGTITAIWLVGMVFSVVLLVLGEGGLGGALGFAITGVLLGRGWVGMAQTMRGRLRRRDLADTAALPPVFATLSPALQRLVRHTRSLQIVVRDPELPLSELDREMFMWITDMAALPPDDRRLLAELGLVPEQLREELVTSRQHEDARERARLAMLMQPREHRRAPRPDALARRPTHRERAHAVLDRFEHEVLQPAGDPFRGGRARREP